MAVPRLTKITLNMGVGEAKTNAKALDDAVEQLATITGQRPVITRAKNSIAGFKIREGMPIGCKVTLRGDRMYEFLDRLMTIALPRIRDFRGINPNSFDGRGNFSLGVREQIIFPEIDYDDVSQGARPRRDHHDDRHRRRARHASSSASSACRSRAEDEGRDGEGSTESQAGADREVQDARLPPLLALRPLARVLPQVRRVPDLPARARPPGRDPRHDEVQLVRHA